MNLSRIASPKVCGYIQAEARDLLPESARGDWKSQQAVDQENGEFLTGGYNIIKRVWCHCNAHVRKMVEAEELEIMKHM